MGLQAGARLGPYEIIAPLGAGGMGEVYRARDSRLNRDVAIKVLPGAFSTDADRLHRFEQEARAAAALNHPNILAVYDVGQFEAVPYIVSELLEGETLRERMVLGPLPLRKVIDHAIQMANGLAAAHEKGIIHRDLKPENLFITNDGRLKILDFGLAKLTQADMAVASASELPTSPPNTQAGLVLGTLGYMAPEQIRGLGVDHRADVFAFGTVLYEMLAGRRAFRGETAADTLSSILKDDPSDLPVAERHIPPSLARIVDRCLEKNPVVRFHSMHDLAIALEGLLSHPESMPAIASATRGWGRRERLAWAAAAVFLVATIAALMTRTRGTTDPLRPIRFGVLPSPDVTLGLGGSGGERTPVVSRDGGRVAFVGARAGQLLLWVRALDDLEAQPLAGTENASHAFWSPDGRRLGFAAGGKLKTVDLQGGPVQILCDWLLAGGATWNDEGTILFSGTGRLFKVPAVGGEPIAVTTPAKGEAHVFPAFLPDGGHFLFTSLPSNTAWVGSLAADSTKKVLNAASQTQYSAGQLLFVRQNTLTVQTFDPKRMTATGDAMPYVDRVFPDAGGMGIPRAAFSASDNGVLAYRRDPVATTQFTWFDRTGRRIGTVGQPGHYRNPVLSPDGARLAFQVADPAGENDDIWLMDLGRGTMSRVTFDPHNDTYPIWSPDGKSIMYGSDREQNGGWNMYQRLASGGVKTSWSESRRWTSGRTTGRPTAATSSTEGMLRRA